MHLKRTYEWIKIALWVAVIVAIGILGYAIWYRYIDLSIISLIALLALLFLLGYCKYAQIMTIRKRFVLVQETFTTLMLVYFSYAYFSGSKTLPGEKILSNTRKKFDDVYEKSRYHLTMPLIMTALKTFGEIKNIKNIIMSEVKNFSTADGFNLNNAESITNEVGKLSQKLGQLSDIVGKGFSSKKSFDEIIDEKADIPNKKQNNKKKTNRPKNEEKKQLTTNKK